VRPLTDEQINLDIGAAAHDALISAVETKVKNDQTTTTTNANHC